MLRSPSPANGPRCVGMMEWEKARQSIQSGRARIRRGDRVSEQPEAREIASNLKAGRSAAFPITLRFCNFCNVATGVTETARVLSPPEIADAKDALLHISAAAAQGIHLRRCSGD